MGRIFIGVVIVNYNSGELLARCLQHLGAQSRAADSIIVVDNGSTDNSLEALPELDALEIVHQPDNPGFAAANNLALRRLADADYIVTLNPDAFARADFIAQLELAAQRHPDYASYACHMLRENGTLDGAGDAYHISGLMWRRGHGRRQLPADCRLQEVFAPCAGAAMYRTRDLLQARGFDESFFCYGEDVDLGYRLRLQGQRCLYLPDASVTHVGSAITGRYPGFATYHGHRNLVWVFIKNTPPGLLLAMLPLHLLMTLAMTVVCALRGELGPYLKAKRDAVSGLGSALGKRKEIQARRTVSSIELLKSFDFSLLPARLFRRE